MSYRFVSIKCNNCNHVIRRSLVLRQRTLSICQNWPARTGPIISRIPPLIKTIQPDQLIQFLNDTRKWQASRKYLNFIFKLPPRFVRRRVLIFWKRSKTAYVEAQSFSFTLQRILPEGSWENLKCDSLVNRLKETRLVTLLLDSNLTTVLCHMGDFGCGDGGWTPVMKMDGNKVNIWVWFTSNFAGRKNTNNKIIYN